MSVQIFMTDFWQIYISDTDSFLTQLWVLTHFGDISKSHLTYLWHNSESDRFMTLIRHISDTFLTVFCNWQFSDRFQTDIWHISEILGTYKSKEYRNMDVRLVLLDDLSHVFIRETQSWIILKMWCLHVMSLFTYLITEVDPAIL